MSRGIFGGMFSGMGCMGSDPIFFLTGQDQRKM